MRIKVALPIAKSIRKGALFVGSDGKSTWVTFKYECLPMYCHYYGLLGHDIKHCSRHHALTNNGAKVTCQYGDWLMLVYSLV